MGDGKKCLLVQRIEDETTARGWKIGLIVAGVLGFLLLVVIVLGALQHRHTRVIELLQKENFL